MVEPIILIFRAAQVVGTIGAVVSAYVTAVKLSRARKVTATVVSGAWRTTYVTPSTGREHQYWFPEFEYTDANGQTRTATTDLGYRWTLPIGSSATLLILQDGTIITNRFREKWMWTIIFAVPALFFLFFWFGPGR